MPRRVLTQTLRNERRALLWWLLGVVGLALVTMAFYPPVRESGEELAAIVEQYPPALAALFGDVTRIGTPAGYLETQLYALMVPVLFLVYAIGRGANAIAGEEEHGTLDLLLAHPVSRARLVMEKAGALAVGVGVLAVALYLSVAVGAFAVDMAIGLGNLAAATLQAALLAVLFGTIALAVGCVRGRRGLAAGAAAGLAAAAYLVDALAPLAAWSEPYARLSPFRYYMGADPLVDGLNVLHAGILLGLTLVLLGLGVAAFERRDVGR